MAPSLWRSCSVIYPSLFVLHAFVQLPGFRSCCCPCSLCCLRSIVRCMFFIAGSFLLHCEWKVYGCKDSRDDEHSLKHSALIGCSDGIWVELFWGGILDSRTFEGICIVNASVRSIFFFLIFPHSRPMKSYITILYKCAALSYYR